MPRKIIVKNDALPPRRSSRIQERDAQKSKPGPVPKKRKTTNARAKKVTPAEKNNVQPSTVHRAAPTAGKGKLTGRNVKRKIEETPDEDTSSHPVSLYPPFHCALS